MNILGILLLAGASYLEEQADRRSLPTGKVCDIACRTTLLIINTSAEKTHSLADAPSEQLANAGSNIERSSCYIECTFIVEYISIDL